MGTSTVLYNGVDKNDRK